MVNSTPRSTALLAAATASAAAALVHAATAGTHAGSPELVRVFAVTAAVQALVAGALLVQPSRGAMVAVAGVNTVAVAAWGMSRTIGLPWPELLQESEDVGAQDLAAAVLGATAALGAVIALAAPRWVASSVRPTAFAGVACTALLAIAVSGVSAEHDHDEPSHDHAHPGDDHTAGDEGVEQAATGGGALPDGPVINLDDVRLTSTQRAAAEDLIDVTAAAMAAFPDQAAVEAAGYVSIGDSVTGFEHFVHVGHLIDGVEMDPNAIESIVFVVEPDGTKRVASAMYILTPGQTMDDVPDIAGELTTWHDHQNLCWEGIRVVGTTDATGRCERGEFQPTPPMLHVWVPGQEPECGPFAGIEGSHGSGCADHDH